MTSTEDPGAVVDSLAASLHDELPAVTRLRAFLATSPSPDALDAWLLDTDGARSVGLDVFRSMALRERIRCALVKGSTSMFRFGRHEQDNLRRFLQGPPGRSTPRRILCVPCSTGEEAFSLAVWLTESKVPFSIDGFDVQTRLVEKARLGEFTLGVPNELLVHPARLSPALLDHLRFEVADLLAPDGAPGALPEGTWDLVCCRYFLGYLRREAARAVLERLTRRIDPKGMLLVEEDCLRSRPALIDDLASLGFHRHGTFFDRRPASARSA